MSQRVLCLDISDNRLAAVLMERHWGWSRLQDRLLLPLPSETEGPEEIARFAAASVREAGLAGDRVVLCLGAERSYVRRIAFPFSSREKIEQALPFEMEPSLPLPKEELLFDFSYMVRSSSGGCKVLGAAMPKTEVGQWIRPLQEQGLDPARIDLDLSPLSGLASYAADLISGPCTAVWHLGRNRSAVAVLQNENIVQTRCFRMGTRDLAGMAAERTGDTAEDALKSLEEAAFSARDSESGAGPDTAEGTDPGDCVLEAYRELMRAVWALQNESPEATVEDVLLTGPGANLRGFISALSSRSGIRFHAVQDLSLPFLSSSPVPEGEISEISPAAYAALLQGKSGSGWNFRKGELAYRSDKSWRRTALYGGVGLGVLLICAVAAFSFHLQLKKQELQRIQTKTEQVFRETVPEASESLRPAQYESVLQNRINSFREQTENAPRNAAGLPPLDLLLFVSKSAPDEEGFQLKRLTMENQEALLVGNAGSYDTVNRIREALLSEQGVDTVQIQGVTANQGEDTVRFTLRVKAGD
ncbi:MAG: pilus assembly protein PilM [Desulfohalobiaceae bacterium]|nr:pilus assembly protein PilM [Desulfohalobiaceae bacterium]